MFRPTLGTLAVALVAMTLAAGSARAVLISYYPLDGNASAVVGPNGTINGSPATVAGAVGTALDFNGSSDFVSVGAGGMGGGSYSLAAWVNQEVATGLQYVSGVQQSNTNGGRLFRVSDGTPQLQHVAPTATVVGVNGSPLSSGFVHLVATFDDAANEIRFYQNGALVGGPVAVTNNSNAIIDNFTIGRRPDSSANFFNGVLDDVAVYSHALSATEVSTVFNTGVLALEAQRSAVGPNIKGPYTADANTLDLYHLNETSGNYIDAGSAARDQNLVGGTRNTFSSDGFGNALAVVVSDLGTGGNAIVKGASTANVTPQSGFQGADGAFTYEALINVSTLNIVGSEQLQILSRENDGGLTSRSFQFRITNGSLELVTLNNSGTQTLIAAIPTVGDQGFVPNEWFHVAVTYDGMEGVADNLKFYWTRVQSDATEANLIGMSQMNADMTGSETGIFAIGSMRRSQFRTPLLGSIDEVRISDIARAPGDFIFQTPPAVPEPATAGLALMAVAGLLRRRRRAG